MGAAILTAFLGRLSTPRIGFLTNIAVDPPAAICLITRAGASDRSSGFNAVPGAKTRYGMPGDPERLSDAFVGEAAVNDQTP